MKALVTIFLLVLAVPVLVFVVIVLGPVMLLILALAGTALALTTLVWLAAIAWSHISHHRRIPPVHP